MIKFIYYYGLIGGFMKSLFYLLFVSLLIISNQSVESVESVELNPKSGWWEDEPEIITIKGVITNYGILMGYERGEHSIYIDLDNDTRWITVDEDDFNEGLDWVIGDEIRISFEIGKYEHFVYNLDRKSHAYFRFGGNVHKKCEGSDGTFPSVSFLPSNFHTYTINLLQGSRISSV